MGTQELQDEFFHQISDLQVILDTLACIPGAMFMVKNLESRYIYMSDKLQQAIHIAPGQEVIGKTDFDLFPKMVAESFRQNDLLVLEQGRTLHNEIHATALFSGPTKWFYSSKTPLHDHEGNIVGLITVNHPYDEIMRGDSGLNQLLPATEHIRNHYGVKVTIADLARLCHLSQSHFMRLFKQRMKMTAYVFLDQVRMYHAIDAIKHSTESIAAIAHQCGFYDHSSFVKRFKKLTGTTPLRYRRQFQPNDSPDQPLILPELTDKMNRP